MILYWNLKVTYYSTENSILMHSFDKNQICCCMSKSEITFTNQGIEKRRKNTFTFVETSRDRHPKLLEASLNLAAFVQPCDSFVFIRYFRVDIRTVRIDIRTTMIIINEP